jgi:hypothetical protein
MQGTVYDDVSKDGLEQVKAAVLHASSTARRQLRGCWSSPIGWLLP